MSDHVRIFGIYQFQALERKVETLSRLIEEAFSERNQAVSERDRWKGMYYDTNDARLAAVAEAERLGYELDQARRSLDRRRVELTSYFAWEPGTCLTCGRNPQHLSAACEHCPRLTLAQKREWRELHGFEPIPDEEFIGGADFK